MDGARTYLTLDDLDIRDQALSAPDDLLRRAERLTLDGVQRSPDLLLAVKRAVDRDRTPGRFLLTGSANLLLSQRVAETLAGRASYLTLWPLSRGELAGEGRVGRWTTLLSRPPYEWPELLSGKDQPADWRSCASRGGYPTPATTLKTPEQRAPKLYWTDTGLALHLGDEETPTGAHLENMVLCDLLAWRDADPTRPSVLYWRTAGGEEVDFVLERRGRLLAAEVKATPRPTHRDARHLRALLDEYGNTVHMVARPLTQRARARSHLRRQRL